jgi:hypothetical protein
MSSKSVLLEYGIRESGIPGSRIGNLRSGTDGP